jgi:hypothetical protein
MERKKVAPLLLVVRSSHEDLPHLQRGLAWGKLSRVERRCASLAFWKICEQDGALAQAKLEELGPSGLNAGLAFAIRVHFINVGSFLGISLVEGLFLDFVELTVAAAWSAITSFPKVVGAALVLTLVALEEELLSLSRVHCALM